MERGERAGGERGESVEKGEKGEGGEGERNSASLLRATPFCPGHRSLGWEDLRPNPNPTRPCAPHPALHERLTPALPSPALPPPRAPNLALKTLRAPTPQLLNTQSSHLEGRHKELAVVAELADVGAAVEGVHNSGRVPGNESGIGGMEWGGLGRVGAGWGGLGRVGAGWAVE